MREITKKPFRLKCKTCGRRVWKISRNRNCVQCATEKVTLARLEMKHKEGATYEKWKKRMIEELGLEN